MRLVENKTDRTIAYNESLCKSYCLSMVANWLGEFFFPPGTEAEMVAIKSSGLFRKSLFPWASRAALCNN